MWQQSIQTGNIALNKNDYQDTSKFNTRINTYQYWNTYKSQEQGAASDIPAFYRDQQHGFISGKFKKSMNARELGYIKKLFFDSITVFKPSVTILTFDWQTAKPGSFDWLKCETQILEEIKTFQDKCQVSAKDTKIILLIMLPLNEEVNVDKCKQSLKNQIQQYQSQQEELGQTNVNGVK